ncbi:hypothetical protein M758_4G136200 [Ceratodon purpureus]|nr:hypothetical protein M758_4G136200 [Ceratodon purpureus]
MRFLFFFLFVFVLPSLNSAFMNICCFADTIYCTLFVRVRQFGVPPSRHGRCLFCSTYT